MRCNEKTIFMDWNEELKRVYEHIEEYLQSGLKILPNKHLAYLAQSLCLLAQRNINFFNFGADGGRSNCSYVDVMKTAIRRQIDLNQKTSLPLINEISIFDLWESQPKQEDFENINNYWKKYLSFSSDDVQKIKKDCSNYVHPTFTLKFPNNKDKDELVRIIYDTCGCKTECINNFINKCNIEQEIRGHIYYKVIELFQNDARNMFNFSNLFVQIIKNYNKITYIGNSNFQI